MLENHQGESSTIDDRYREEVDEGGGERETADDKKSKDDKKSNVSGDDSILDNSHVSLPSYSYFEEVGTDSFDIDLDELQSRFTFPISGNRSSSYGPRGSSMHYGLDIAAPQGTPIYAVFEGKVRMSKSYGDYGKVIVVEHGSGLESVYAHNHTNLVKAGEFVKSGQRIATCGRTGNATGNHLHFEFRIDGQTFDPETIIDVQNKSLKSGVLTLTKDKGGKITATIKDKESISQSSANSSKGIKVGDNLYDAPAKVEKWHTIVRGDTLSQIAQRYGVSISELCELNDITKDEIIKTGEKLRVQ